MKYSRKDRAVGLRMPRSRGAVSGLLLVMLGAWGALIPFVGPHFNFAYTPNQDWAWTTARGWLEVFPGSRHRGGWPAADHFRKSRRRDVRRLAGRSRRGMVRGGRAVRPAAADRHGRRSGGHHRPQAGPARGRLLFRPRCPDCLPERDRLSAARGSDGPRYRVASARTGPRACGSGAGRQAVHVSRGRVTVRRFFGGGHQAASAAFHAG